MNKEEWFEEVTNRANKIKEIHPAWDMEKCKFVAKQSMPRLTEEKNEDWQ